MKCYNERKTDDMDLPGNMANMTINVNSSSIQTANNSITSNQNLTNNTIIENTTNTTSTIPLEECLICSDLKRDTIFKVSLDI